MHAVFDGLYWMPRSPSAKRAWIEIRFSYVEFGMPRSPSAKRAWIEMLIWLRYETILAVALCEEGVDRNWRTAANTYVSFGRPLRRGRG